MQPWDSFLTRLDRAHISMSPPRRTHGFGEKTALLSIDNYRKAVGDRPEPILESIKKWPASTGISGWHALEHVRELFRAARGSGVTVIHATGLPGAESGLPGIDPRADGRDRSRLTLDEQDRRRRRMDFVEQAMPIEGEVILKKTGPSAFFGTPLTAQLAALGVDTLVVCGETTSGCIRATVVDGCSLGFRMIVAQEAVYDRHEASHAINLFDMAQKYADVLPVADVVAGISAYASGLARAEP